MPSKKETKRKMETVKSSRTVGKTSASGRRNALPGKVTTQDLPPNENIKKGADEVYGDMQLPQSVRRKAAINS
jgi:hypothetical protein